MEKQSRLLAGTNIISMSILPKLIYKTNLVPVRSLVGFSFPELEILSVKPIRKKRGL